jgi:crossover junction endodeoxyribonuclease RuvC
VLVLGIDPGTRLLGWGVVSRSAQRLIHVGHGVLKLDAKAPLPERLQQIEVGLVDVIERYRPEAASVESLFFHKDAQAAAKLGHARGVVLLALSRAAVPIHEYAPARVKRTVVGGGQAGKDQVAQMVRALLGLPSVPPPDAADALAIAMTHLRTIGLSSAIANLAARRASRVTGISAAVKAARRASR